MWHADVRNQLSHLVDVKPSSPSQIENYATSISEILKTCAANNIPCSKFKSYAKPYWSADVKAAHENAVQKRRVWIENGKPRGMQHVSYAEYKREKSKCRKVLRNAIFEFESQQLIDINESSESTIFVYFGH